VSVNLEKRIIEPNFIKKKRMYIKCPFLSTMRTSWEIIKVFLQCEEELMKALTCLENIPVLPGKSLEDSNFWQYTPCMKENQQWCLSLKKNSSKNSVPSDIHGGKQMILFRTGRYK
jgi:hypothetical protein